MSMSQPMSPPASPMMSVKLPVKVGKTKQLIDINGDSTNFDATFRVVSLNKEPFELLVVDQTTLDNNVDLEHKKVTEGEISGRVVHDKNVKQNYFLILKADKDCDCEVSIERRDLPKTVAPPPQQVQTPPPPVGEGTSWFAVVLVLGLVIVVGVAVYWFFFRKKEGVEDPPSPSSRSGVVGSASPKATPVRDDPFLQRLKSLNLD